MERLAQAITATSVVVFTHMPDIDMGPMPEWAINLFNRNFPRQATPA